jgi:hypothetical protein
MDKLKLILDFLKKYLFWFIFAVTIVLVLVFWWMSTASLAKSFQQEQVKIKKKFDEVKAIDDDKRHPTPDFIKKVNEQNQKLKEGVLKVWETLYNAQMENNPWPKEVLGDSADEIGRLGSNAAIRTELRERYQNSIKKYFPILYKIIDLRHPSDAPEGSGGGGGNAAPALLRNLLRPGMPQPGRRPAENTAENSDWVGTVDWDESDRLRLEERFNWTARPDSDVIRIRQEDLWVYKTLLQVISETNKDVDSKTPVANVKRIEWIQIGADAIGSWMAADQSVFKATPDAAAQAAAPAGGRSAPAAAPRDAAAQDSKEQLLKDRYVDDKGVGLDAEAKQPYSEFKMMPISMKLYIDQRKISKLLVECAKSPMPIEVRRVDIRRVASELLEAGTGAAASPTGPTRDYNRRTVDARGPARPNAAGVGGEDSAAASYDIPVEIQGIIYIYNPPDLNTLGTGTAAEKPAETLPGAAPAADAGAPGATPAAVPTKPAETAPAKP